MKKGWSCKIGEVDEIRLPANGADFPMRRAVIEAYIKLTGKDPIFMSSGWGEELTTGERLMREMDKEREA